MVKKKKNRLRTTRTIFVVILLLIIMPVCAWWLWKGLFPATPRFNAILININSESHNILPNETISLHTSDQVKIVKVSTNILFNMGVRLSTEGFDVNALRHDRMPLSSLLPNQNIYNHYKFRVFTKYRNLDLGFTDWEIQPYAEEWLEKANKTISDEQRIALLEQAMRVLPEDGSVWRRLLDEYKAQRLWKQAASMLEAVAKEDPNRKILSELVEVYTAMSSKAELVSVLKKMVTLEPENVSLRLQLAEIFEKSKKYKDAITQYERIKWLVVSNKEKLYVYERLGYLYSETGGYKYAISGYLKAVKLNPKDANLYYNLSYLYEKTDQTRKSYEYLEKAIALNPKDMDSRLILAQRLMEKGQLKKADRYLTEILKKAPSSLKALLLKAKITEKQGKKKELKEIYKRIHSIDPKNDAVLYNLGALCYESGELKTGLSYLTKYIRKNAKDVAAHEMVYDIHRKQKNDQEAFRTAQTIVKLKPGEVSLYYFMFDYLSKRNKYKEIIPIFEQGVKSNPKDTGLREQLLFVYLKTGNEDLALKQMNEMLKLKPKDVALWLQTARLYEKHENHTKAMEAYKRVLDLSPDNEEAGEAYLRLRLKAVGIQ